MDETDPREPVAARLVASLEAEAEVVGVGAFDIDAGRALDKLQRFALAEPRAYVLRLAEAGLLAGATQLRFGLREAWVRVSFDRPGPPIVIAPEILARLLAVLLGATPRPLDPGAELPRPVLVQLAIAIVAVLGLDPLDVAIESVGADGRGVRQHYVGDAPAVALAGAAPGTRVYVREQGQRLEAALERSVEHELIRTHCRYAERAIFLDRRRISQQRVLERPRCWAPVYREGVQIGVAGFEHGNEPARALLLSHGLLIETLILTDCAPGFVAAIDLPLPRDLSQSSIARTPQLDAALAPAYAIHHQLRQRG